MKRGESDSGGSDEGAPTPRLSKHDGHPFEASRSGACGLCGESAEHILHHPTRIRAACALRGIDPEPLLRRAQR